MADSGSTDRGAAYVVGTFDTKGAELRYVADLIRATGIEVRTVDLSTHPEGAATDAAGDAAADPTTAHAVPTGQEPLEGDRHGGHRGAPVAGENRVRAGGVMAGDLPRGDR
ncbi:MAG: hypothetical protein QOH45_1517, partial [Pseudonocardiales bacterium]|nr:hypothetical protein [Pseudonocardiales bacterium]